MTQRVIKYRAWDGEQMLYPEAGDIIIHIDDGGLVVYQLIENDPDDEDAISDYSTKQINAEVMQFTGKVDKNGTELYEGDIYRYSYEYDSDYDGDMPIVKTSTGVAVIKDIFERILDHLKEHPGDWTSWIAQKLLHGDKRKMRELLQHLESEGKIVGKKNALNHYVWHLKEGNSINQTVKK